LIGFKLWKIRHLAIIKKSCTIDFGGLSMRVLVNDRRAYVLSRSSGKGLQPHLLHALIQLSYQENFDYFLDIGANYGEFVAKVSPNIGRKTFAIEARRDVSLLLRKTFRDYQKIQVENVAIFSKNQEVTLYKLQGYSGGNSLHSAHLASLDPKTWWGTNGVINSEKVQGITLDHFFKIHELSFESNFLVKIDVEGHEKEVWDGASLVFSKANLMYILLEFSPLILNSAGNDPKVFWRQIQQFPGIILDKKFDESKLDIELMTLPLEHPDQAVDVLIKVSPRGMR